MSRVCYALCKPGRAEMNESERQMLEELKKHLKGKLHRDCVDAYLKNPEPAAIAKAAIQKLEKAIDEANRP